MRALGEIIEAARSGERPDYDELRYAVCAMDTLMTFDQIAFSRLAEAEMAGKRAILSNSAKFQHEERFNRIKRALGVDPKSYLGESNDPDNPDYQERRKASQRFVGKILSRVS